MIGGKIMRKKKKKIINGLVERINELETKLSKDLLSKELEGRRGYYNHEMLMKSNGLITKDEKQPFRIRESLLYLIKTSLFGLFDYINLPVEIPKYEIEKLLFEDGKCLFFELGGKFYITRFISEGVKDNYNRVLKVRPSYADGVVGDVRTVGEDCIIIENNILEMSTLSIIDPFLNRATQNFETASANLKVSMMKWLVIADGGELQNVKAELQRLFDRNGFFGFASTDLNENIKEFKFWEEFDSSSYWEDFNNTLNFIYTLLGIATNPNEDKKERLLVDEITMNENKTNLILEGLFKSRNDAIKKINELFSLNINVIIDIDYMGEEEKVNEDEINNEEQSN